MYGEGTRYIFYYIRKNKIFMKLLHFILYFDVAFFAIRNEKLIKATNYKYILLNIQYQSFCDSKI